MNGHTSLNELWTRHSWTCLSWNDWVGSQNPISNAFLRNRDGFEFLLYPACYRLWHMSIPWKIHHLIISLVFVTVFFSFFNIWVFYSNFHTIQIFCGSHLVKRFGLVLESVREGGKGKRVKRESRYVMLVMLNHWIFSIIKTQKCRLGSKCVSLISNGIEIARNGKIKWETFHVILITLKMNFCAAIWMWFFGRYILLFGGTFYLCLLSLSPLSVLFFLSIFLLSPSFVSFKCIKAQECQEPAD